MILMKEEGEELVVPLFYRFIFFVEAESWQLGRRLQRLVCCASDVSVHSDIVIFHPARRFRRE